MTVLLPVADGPSNAPARNLHLVELAPIQDAVVAARRDERIAVLHAVGVDRPFVRVVRPIEVRAVAWRQEAPGPDVELGRQLELRGRIEHVDVVRRVVLGVEHVLDVRRRRSAHVQPDAVERERIGGIAAVGRRVHVAGLQPGADGDGGLREERRAGERNQERRQERERPSPGGGFLSGSCVHASPLVGRMWRVKRVSRQGASVRPAVRHAFVTFFWEFRAASI